MTFALAVSRLLPMCPIASLCPSWGDMDWMGKLQKKSGKLQKKGKKVAEPLGLMVQNLTSKQLRVVFLG